MKHASLVAVVLVGLCACHESPYRSDFLFGASLSGFQVEAGCPTESSGGCEDKHSDWYQFVNAKAELTDLASSMSFEPLDAGPGLWELYDQDFSRAETELGLSAIRLSLEWSRIFPNATDGLEGEALRAAADASALERYHQMFASLKKHHLKPLVTVNHYTLPVWLHDGVACHRDLAKCEQRGWLDAERTKTEISKFAAFVAQEFGDEVDVWATLNEPFAVVLPGYVLPSADRVNPPALRFKFAEAKQVMVAMIEAHARMYDAIVAADQRDADGDGKNAMVGLVYSLTPTAPKNPQSEIDRIGADNAFYLYNTAFLDGVVKGLVDADLNGRPDTEAPRDDLAGRMDYLGINFYTRVQVEGSDKPELPQLSAQSAFNPLTLSLWSDEPKGIYDMLMHVKTRYGVPTIITETGVNAAADSTAGASWLVRYLAWTTKAIREGADVRGFFYWSLIDNYEWNHGMAMRFGLYAVGTDVNKTRSAREAVQVYRSITKTRAISADLAKKHGVSDLK